MERDSEVSKRGQEVIVRGHAVQPTTISLLITPWINLRGRVTVYWEGVIKIDENGSIKRSTNPPYQWLILETKGFGPEFIRALIQRAREEPPLALKVSSTSSWNPAELASTAMREGFKVTDSILGCLLEAHFSVFVPRASYLPETLEGLNHKQLKAYETLVRERVSLVQGLPGSGKSRLMTEIARKCFQKNLRVLLTAETNNACEVLCGKLVNAGIAPVWNRSKRAPPPKDISLLKYSTDNIIRSGRWTREEIIQKAPIVIATTTKATTSSICARTNHLLLIDEGGLIPAYRWPALRLIKTNALIICGDPAQNPPYKEAVGEFSILLSNHYHLTTVLTTQYRMPPSISSFSNDISYMGMMIDAREDPILPNSLYPECSHHVVFIDTPLGDCPSQKVYDSSINYTQINTTLALLKILERSYDLRNVQVISPYDAQVQILSVAMNPRFSRAPLPMTITRVQGHESDIIVLNMVKSTGFPEDKRIVNVAASRAKTQLYIIGDHHSLRQIPFWQRTINKWGPPDRKIPYKHIFGRYNQAQRK